jgi:toxin-antitoxin system PIN domain toxin
VKTPRLLADANVLLALAWPNHPFNAAATRRLAGAVPWATCPLTRTAFVRLSSNPAVVGQRVTPLEAWQLLAVWLRDEDHVALDREPAVFAAHYERVLARCLGHNQVNDAYLVALAAAHSVRVLTFDAPLEALAPADGLVEVLKA